MTMHRLQQPRLPASPRPSFSFSGICVYSSDDTRPATFLHYYIYSKAYRHFADDLPAVQKELER